MATVAPSVVYGIHLGNTSASLAISKDGRTSVVANDSGDRLTPAVVAFTDREVLVGAAAKQQLTRNAPNSVANVKRLLGVYYSKEVVPEGPLQIINRSGKPAFDVEYKTKRQTFTPIDVGATILKDLLKLGQGNTGSASKDAVLTVPTKAPLEFKRDLLAAAKAAGLNVLRLVKEPVAAVLAYGIGQESRSFDAIHVLVFRIGGISAEASVVAVQNGLVRILSSSAASLGGDRFTSALSQLLATDFQRKTKLDPFENKRSKAKLWTATEVTKNILSTLNSAPCSIESLCEGVDLQNAVTRARYESLIGSLIQDCVGMMKDVAEESGFPVDAVDSSSSHQIHKVILCGAVSRTPALQKAVHSCFPKAQLLESIAPDEVLAYGCAVEASLLSSAEESEPKRIFADEETSFSCLPNSVYVRSSVSAASVQLLFSQFSPLGFSRNCLTMKTEGNTWFCLEVLEDGGDEGQEETKVEDVQIKFPIENGINETQPNDVNGKESTPEETPHTVASKESTPECVPTNSLNLLARILLKDITEDQSEVTITGHLKKEGSLLISCAEKKSGKTETLLIEADSS